MNALLMATVLALGAADKAEGAAPTTAGRWTIVYAEEGGRRNTSWEAKPAVIKDGALSYEDEGKKRTLKLKFGPDQTLTGTGLDKDGDKAHKGVYVAGREYLTISLVTQDKRAGGSSGDFILILRRQRGPR